MNQEKPTPNEDPNEPLPQPEVAVAQSEPERIPAELLAICRDDMEQAERLMEQANEMRARAQGVFDQVQRRISRKLSLLPVDTYDLATGIVTRGKPDEVQK